MTLEDRITQENDKDPEDNVMPTETELKAIDITAGWLYRACWNEQWAMSTANKKATELIHKLQGGFIIVDREGLEERLADWLRKYISNIQSGDMFVDTTFEDDAGRIIKVLYGD